MSAKNIQQGGPRCGECLKPYPPVRKMLLSCAFQIILYCSLLTQNAVQSTRVEGGIQNLMWPKSDFGHYANLPDEPERCGKSSSSTRMRVINPGWGRMLPGSLLKMAGRN